MEKITTQSSETIIKKAKHAAESLPNFKEVDDSIRRLSEPFGQIEYKESDFVDFEVGEGKLEFGYSEVEGHLTDVLTRYIEHQIHDGSKSVEIDTTFTGASNWRRVIRLRYKIGQKTYDLLKLCPEAYNIFFCPNVTETGGSLLESKNIFIEGNIATPKAIVTLFHEVGHIWDNFKLKLMGKNYLVDDHKYSSLAENLRRERMASAYALNAIRPFLSSDTQKTDVVNFLKHYALLSYHLDTNKTIEDREYLERFLSGGGDWDTDVDHDFDYYFNSFELWKLTPKYEELKSQFLPAIVYPEEEFSYWRNWVESTKYEFWKDLLDYEG